jgi:hypothetical protein
MQPILASAGGSELPWFTPIVVSLLLVVVAGLYRFRHRRQDPPPPHRTFEAEGDPPVVPTPANGDDGNSPFLLPRTQS